MTIARPPWWRTAGAVVLALAAGALITDFGQGGIPLENGHEGRVFETARTMLATGDWIVPSFLGETRFEKPPLAYWASALAFRLGGLDPRVGRWPLAVAAAAMLLATGWIGRMIGDRRLAWIAPLVLAASWLFVREMRRATTDPYLASTCIVAVACFLSSWRADRSRRRIAAAISGWLAVALALLAKGPIAFLWVGLGTLCLRRRGIDRLAPLPIVSGLMASLLPVAAWALLVAHVSDGGFSVWTEEIVSRLDGRGDGGDGGRLFVYVSEFPLAALPWTPVLGLGLFTRSAGQPGLRRWLFIGLAVLTMISSRKAAYLAPLLPAMALLTGATLLREEASATGRGRLVRFNIVLVLLFATGFAIWTAAFDEARTPRRSLATPVLIVAIAAISACGWRWVWVRATTSARRAALVVGAASMILAQGVLLPALDEPEIDRAIGVHLRASATPADELFGWRKQHPVASFYARRPIRTVAHLEELPSAGEGGRTWLIVRARDRADALAAGFEPAGPADESLVLLRRRGTAEGFSGTPGPTPRDGDR